MLTPTAAFFVASARKPDAIFEQHCIDYKGTWGFSYTTEDSDPTQDFAPKRIFVDQETGHVSFNDPLFDVMLWVKSEDHANKVDFGSVEKRAKLLRSIGG